MRRPMTASEQRQQEQYDGAWGPDAIGFKILYKPIAGAASALSSVFRGAYNYAKEASAAEERINKMGYQHFCAQHPGETNLLERWNNLSDVERGHYTRNAPQHPPARRPSVDEPDSGLVTTKSQEKEAEERAKRERAATEAQDASQRRQFTSASIGHLRPGPSRDEVEANQMAQAQAATAWIVSNMSTNKQHMELAKKKAEEEDKAAKARAQQEHKAAEDAEREKKAQERRKKAPQIKTYLENQIRNAQSAEYDDVKNLLLLAKEFPDLFEGKLDKDITTKARETLKKEYKEAKELYRTEQRHETKGEIKELFKLLKSHSKDRLSSNTIEKSSYFHLNKTAKFKVQLNKLNDDEFKSLDRDANPKPPKPIETVSTTTIPHPGDRIFKEVEILISKSSSTHYPSFKESLEPLSQKKEEFKRETTRDIAEEIYYKHEKLDDDLKKNQISFTHRLKDDPNATQESRDLAKEILKISSEKKYEPKITGLFSFTSRLALGPSFKKTFQELADNATEYKRHTGKSIAQELHEKYQSVSAEQKKIFDDNIASIGLFSTPEMRNLAEEFRSIKKQSEHSLSKTNMDPASHAIVDLGNSIGFLLSSASNSASTSLTNLLLPKPNPSDPSATHTITGQAINASTNKTTGNGR